MASLRLKISVDDKTTFEAVGNNLDLIPSVQDTAKELNSLISNAERRRNSTLYFTQTDCETEVDGVYNCASVCSDATSLFTPWNLRACILIASATLLLQNGTLTIGGSDLETNATMRRLGISAFRRSDAVGTLDQVQKCILQSNSIDVLGAYTTSSLGSVVVTADNLSDFSDGLEDYGREYRGRLNGDIAGPGVAVTYFIQYILALVFYFLFKIFTSWTHRVIRLATFCCASSRKRAHTLQDKFANSRVGAAIESSIIEFQEVQTYLIASLQLAAIICFSYRGADIDSASNESFAAAMDNTWLVKMMGTFSLSCILLVQCCLQRAGRRWWYTFLIVTLAFAFSLAIPIVIREPPSAIDIWNQLQERASLPACGSNPSPKTYSTSPIFSRYYMDERIVQFIVVPVWVGLLIDQVVGTVPTRFPAVARWFVKWDADKRVRTIFESRIWKASIALYWLAAQVALLVLAFPYNSIAIGLLSLVTETRWGFGQLIAVTVWAPTIVKYAYFNIFGVKEGFEERIARSYTITEPGKPSDPSNEKTGFPKHIGDSEVAINDPEAALMATHPLFGAEGRPSSPSSQHDGSTTDHANPRET